MQIVFLKLECTMWNTEHRLKEGSLTSVNYDVENDSQPE